MRRILECTGALLLLTGGLQAGERVVLKSGFDFHADRHEVEGDVVRVYTGTGVTEFAQAAIAEYRPEEYTVPPPALPAPPEPVAQAAGITATKASNPRDLIRSTVARKKLPKELVALVASVVKQESGFHPNALSPKGAIGLMQLMPATARQLGASNPRDPQQNIEAGTEYLTELLVKYEDRDDQVIRALAAYNAGPGAVDRYKGVPPYRETRDYVRRVVRNYLNEQKTAAE